MEKIKVNMFFKEDEKETNRLLQEYYSCPQAVKYINQLNIKDDQIRENIAKISNFVSDLKYCEGCKGCDECKKENPCFITKITNENGIVAQTLVPCKKLVAKMEFESQFVVRDFTSEWTNYSLKNDMNRSKDRIAAVTSYMEWKQGLKDNWIYLNGGMNSGRSFIAALMVVDAARNLKGPIAYLDSTKRIKELNDLNYINKEEFQSQLDMLASVNILVLDDFGNEYKNDFVRDAILLDVLQRRASNKLLTIFTSDFTIKEIVDLHSNNTPGKIRAKQLGNIISKMCVKEINLGELSIY